MATNLAAPGVYTRNRSRQAPRAGEAQPFPGASSTTLQAPQWTNTTVLNGDLAEAVTTLRRATERAIFMHGYGPVAKTLIRHGLPGELILCVHPMLAGAGTCPRPAASAGSAQLTTTRRTS